MTPFFIGISGGSGAGKTAIAKALKKRLGKKSAIFHLDNYQRIGENIAKTGGMKNWDHPDAVNWVRLYKDLVLLKSGKQIFLTSRSQKKLNNPIKIIFSPAEIIIAEGYLLFYKKSIRKIINFLVYLDAIEKTRIKRRSKPLGKDNRYIKKVLLPMHQKYIVPTKIYANLILDTDKCKITECVNKIITRLKYKNEKL